MSGLKGVLDKLNKTYGKNSVNKVKDMNIEVNTISSGLISMDIAGSGLPESGIIEIYGPESSGKTTLAVQILSHYQKSKGHRESAFIDAENAFDPNYAQELDLDLGELIFAQPECGEDGFEIIKDLIKSDEVGVIVCDSVTAMKPRKEIEGEAGDSHMGLHARLMSQQTVAISNLLKNHKCLVIFINQLRMKIGVVFGNPETTTGGNSLKYWAKQRWDVRRSGSPEKDKAGNPVSGMTKIKNVKNKIGPPFRTALVRMDFGHGFNNVASVIDLSVSLELIEKSGAWYKVDGVNVAQGKTKMIEFLMDNPEKLDELTDKIKKHYNVKS